MPNAKDASNIGITRKFFVLGETGSGKTTQLLTLPGKKFAYLFDPNAILSLRGYDVDYEEFLPDQLSLAIHSLKKDNGGDKSSGAKGSDLYMQWEEDFNTKMRDGFFDSYDVIAVDSATTLLDLIMDRVLTINGRFGQWPDQSDYGPQMVAFTNICRSLTSCGKMVYMTGHLDVRQDELTKRIYRRPMMTGRLTSKIPLLFSDVFVAESESIEKGMTYRIQTMPDRMTTCVRTSIKGLDTYEDVTIDFGKDPVGQGLGGILNWESRQK
jgi:adenylate kinase family enzyme